jgi:microsomal dipeptidase-like Zn-dependent dipeptidase
LRSIRPNGSGSRYHAPSRTSGARMAKLYFYYSAMNAGKTTNLLQSAYNYYERGMRTLILTPALDNRYGEGVVASRIGLTATCWRWCRPISRRAAPCIACSSMKRNF